MGNKIKKYHLDIIKGIKLKDKTRSLIVQVGSNDVYSDLKVKEEYMLRDCST